MRGVGDPLYKQYDNSLYQWYVELATLCINNTQSRQFPVSMICGVGDSLYQQCAESMSLRINSTESLYKNLKIQTLSISDNGESILDYDCPCKFESIIEEAKVIV